MFPILIVILISGKIIHTQLADQRKCRFLRPCRKYSKIARKWDEESDEGDSKNSVQGSNGNRMENVLWKYLDEEIHYSQNLSGEAILEIACYGTFPHLF